MIINIHPMSELFCDNGLTTDWVIPLLPGVKHTGRAVLIILVKVVTWCT